MLKQQAVLEVKKGENTYTFVLPATAPIGEVHDVLYQMRGFVVEKILEVQKTEAPKEEPKSDILEN